MFVAAILAATMQSPLCLMSFNVRYAGADDGPDSWVYRRGLVFEVINRRRPEVLGVQEALASQVDELLVHLRGYSYVGVGREDGKRGGEFSALFFRRDRLSVLDSGTFWLSGSPEVVGSKSWGNAVVRICTWARFRDRDGSEFTVFNAHFDHESQPSRDRSALLVITRVQLVAGPVVLMGDFNVGEQDPAIHTLLRGGLVDTFRALHPGATDVGTYTGFDPRAIKGEKIDYVFVGAGWRVLESGIDRSAFDGRLPSDHFPVWAVVERP